MNQPQRRTRLALVARPAPHRGRCEDGHPGGLGVAGSPGRRPANMRACTERLLTIGCRSVPPVGVSGASVQITTELQHRALAFVDACNTNGFLPTVYEVQCWLQAPTPESALVGQVLAPAKARILSGVVDEHGDESLDHLNDLEWIEGYPDVLSITTLGWTLLAAAEHGLEAIERANETVQDHVSQYLCGRPAGRPDLPHIHSRMIALRRMAGEHFPAARDRRPPNAPAGVPARCPQVPRRSARSVVMAITSNSAVSRATRRIRAPSSATGKRAATREGWALVGHGPDGRLCQGSRTGRPARRSPIAARASARRSFG